MQSDLEHLSVGLSGFAKKLRIFINILFKDTYTNAGVVNVTSDDGFNMDVTCHANLSFNTINIHVFYSGEK